MSSPNAPWAGSYPATEPAWQTARLNALSQQGKLSGINPVILGAIAQEESNFEIAGAGYNSAGYGGFFGLGAFNYPGGNSETVAQLLDPSQASFDQQAITAAAEFNSGLQKYGSVSRAESWFQTGNPDANSQGVQLVNQALSGTSGGGSAAPDTAPGTTNAPTTTATASGTKLLSTPLGDVTLPTGIVTRIVLAVLGIAVLAIALNKLFDGGASAPQVITEGGQQTATQVKAIGNKANEGRPPDAGPPMGRKDAQGKNAERNTVIGKPHTSLPHKGVKFGENVGKAAPAVAA